MAHPERTEQKPREEKEPPTEEQKAVGRWMLGRLERGKDGVRQIYRNQTEEQRGRLTRKSIRLDLPACHVLGKLSEVSFLELRRALPFGLSWGVLANRVVPRQWLVNFLTLLCNESADGIFRLGTELPYPEAGLAPKALAAYIQHILNERPGLFRTWEYRNEEYLKCVFCMVLYRFRNISPIMFEQQAHDHRRADILYGHGEVEFMIELKFLDFGDLNLDPDDEVIFRNIRPACLSDTFHGR